MASPAAPLSEGPVSCAALRPSAETRCSPGTEPVRVTTSPTASLFRKRSSHRDERTHRVGSDRPTQHALDPSSEAPVMPWIFHGNSMEIDACTKPCLESSVRISPEEQVISPSRGSAQPAAVAFASRRFRCASRGRSKSFDVILVNYVVVQYSQ